MNASGGEQALAHLFCQSRLSLSDACDCALAALKRIKNINARNKLQMSRVAVHCWQSTVWVLPQATPTQLMKSGISFDQTNSWNQTGHLLPETLHIPNVLICNKYIDNVPIPPLYRTGRTQVLAFED